MRRSRLLAAWVGDFQQVGWITLTLLGQVLELKARSSTSAAIRALLGLAPKTARRLREAIARAPHMVAGSGRVDTRLMAHFGARVCCKGGAEGVHCIALPELGLGVAVKMDDGNTARACEVVMAAVVERLLPLADDEARFMRGFSDAPIVNWNGIEVGRLRAGAALRAAA